MSEIKGYKVFNPDWTCRGFQYEANQAYEIDGKLEMCKNGFHFCIRAVNCFDYYNFDPKNRVAEIAALGEVLHDGKKSCTDKIRIVREIPWAELLTLVNTGEGNTGHQNSGHQNSGDQNSGDQNSGHWNSGDQNSGHQNSGHWNSGDQNSGDQNSGHWNSGDQNSGHQNSGHWNSGNQNSGHWNSGDFNLSDHETGCFCTETHKLRFFDVESDMTFGQWRSSKAYRLLCQISYCPTTWVDSGDMTDMEKEQHPTHETTGGYLRKNDLTQVNQKWWDSLTAAERDTIRSIPNFDPIKFNLIMGIQT